MPVPTTPAVLDTTRRLLPDMVFDVLYGRIIDGTLAPGTKLDDSAIAAELAVSKAPVRQAFGRLSDMGLVDMAPNRYTKVATPDVTLLAAGVSILTSLWKLAAETSVPALTDDRLADFEQRHDVVIALTQSPTREQEHLLVTRVHLLFGFLVETSGNPLLGDVVERVEVQVAHIVRAGVGNFDYERLAALFAHLRGAVMERSLPAVNEAIDEFSDIAAAFVERFPAPAASFAR